MTDILSVQPPLAIAGLQKPGAIISVHGKRLIWKGEFGDGELNVEDFDTGQLYRPLNHETGVRQIATTQWLQNAMAEGAFEILTTHDGKPYQEERVPRPELDRSEILNIDPFAEARLTLLRELNNASISRSNPNLSSHIDRIWSATLQEKFGKRPATSTVREWMTWTDPILPALSQLVSHSGRVPRAKRLDPLVREVIDKRTNWYWDGNPGRQIKDAHAAGFVDILALNKEREAQGLEPLEQPSREAYRRAIRASECRENYERKFGKVAAERYWRASGSGKSSKHVLQLVYMDDTVLDAVACIRTRNGRRYPAGRPYLCAALDDHSRAILGFVLSFTPPTTYTAAECLKRVGREKVNLSPQLVARYPVLRQIAGKPEKLYVDNGKNYASAAFQDACAEAVVTLLFAPIATPEAKAKMERFFRTLKTWLLAKVAGYTASPQTLRELNFDPATKAVLLVEELEDLIQQFINTYHINIHSGINEQPAAAWLRSIEARPRSVLNERALSAMTYLTIHGRRLTPNGVRWQKQTYTGEEVNQLLDANTPREKMRSRLKSVASATVKIKIDPTNVGHIWVFNPETRAYVELRSTQPEYAWGLSLDEHQHVQAWVKKQNLAFNTEAERLTALHALNEYIDAKIPTLKVRDRRAIARTHSSPPQEAREVEIVHAEPRHDGFGEIIEHMTADSERLDWDLKPSRPKSGVVAEGGSHDADPRDDIDDCEFDPDTGLFMLPEDEDEAFEEDYA